MHAVPPPALLRMTWFDALDANSQPEPPHGELTQVEQSVGGSKGHAIVAADVGRQAALLKKPFKHGKSIVFFGGGERFAGEQITTGMIGDGQWVAVFVIAQQELAFVIGAPEFIRSLAQR